MGQRGGRRDGWEGLRFRVASPKCPPTGDRFSDTVREVLRALLDVIVLLQDGRELRPDSFRVLERGAAAQPIFPELQTAGQIGEKGGEEE